MRVKSPPTARYPDPPASAKIPSTLLTAGVPRLQQPRERADRQGFRARRRRGAQVGSGSSAAVVLVVPPDVHDAVVQRDRLDVAVGAAQPSRGSGGEVERGEVAAVADASHEHTVLVDPQRHDRRWELGAPVGDRAVDSLHRAKPMHVDAVERAERSADDDGRFVRGQRQCRYRAVRARASSWTGVLRCSRSPTPGTTEVRGPRR